MMQVEWQNTNEREAIEKHEALKGDFKDIAWALKKHDTD